MIKVLTKSSLSRCQNLTLFLCSREKVCCGIIFRGPHGEVAIDPRFLNPCNSCKEPLIKDTSLTPLSSNNNFVEEMDSSTSETEDQQTNLQSSASAKLITDEVDDEGFFDKPAVSPSESGTSTPPPSEPESYLSNQQDILG